MDLKKLFQSAMSKQNETWNHSIIKTKADLKNWLVYEKAKYDDELSPGGDFAYLRKTSFGNIRKGFAKLSFI